MSALKKFRKTIVVTVDGEEIPVTVRKLGTADIFEIANTLPTVYQQMVDKPADLAELAGSKEKLAREGLEIAKAMFLLGVVDPPVCEKPSADCLSISDFEDTSADTADGRLKPIMDIIEAIAELSDMEGLFRSSRKKPKTTAKTKRATRKSS